MHVDKIVAILNQYSFNYSSEDELQTAIAGALKDAGILVTREVDLDKHNRIDILIERIGIEIKINGSLSAIERQLLRYAKSPLIDSLILITTKSKHCNVAKTLAGKPIYLYSLFGSF